MYTDYFIDRDGHVYGPDGPTDSEIKDDKVLLHGYKTSFYVADRKYLGIKSILGIGLKTEAYLGLIKNRHGCLATN